MLLNRNINESIENNKLENDKCMEKNVHPPNRFKNSSFPNRLALTNRKLSVLFAGFAIAIALVLGAGRCRECFNKLEDRNSILEIPKKTYCAFIKGNETCLSIVHSVLAKLGYRREQLLGAPTENWDLFWVFEYPFHVSWLKHKLKNLKPHQRVNHFPGNGVITHKANLATSGLNYIPPGFKLPRDKEKFLEYVRNHPNAKFVQKNDNHKDIKIIGIDNKDLNKTGSFIQEFVERPLLVDGHKFDIGIYVVISSINPLRAYIYKGEALVKYCKEKYYPFDPENLDKYVVFDPYLPTWEIPVLDYYHKNLSFGVRDTFNAYLRTQGLDPSIIWTQTEDAIRTVLLAKEQEMLSWINKLNFHKRNFFELLRFDFVVDEDLRVYLMEANMSPNLWSADWQFNILLYKQLLYNFLSLVGIGERLYRNSLGVRLEEEELIVSEKHLATYPEECSSELCKTSCPLECQLCKPCLSPEVREDLIRAFKEHLHQGDFKRIFPPVMTKEEAMKPIEGNYSQENKLHYSWFKGKCLLDSSWC